MVLRAFIATLLTAALLWLIFQLLPIDIWADMALSKGGLSPEYCELNRMDRLIRQPLNTWSNLAFGFFGYLMILSGIQDRRQNDKKYFVQQYPVLSIIAGISSIYLCLGSFFFHASLTRLGQHFDMGGTYAAVLGIIGIGLFRNIRLRFPDFPVAVMILLILIADVLVFVFKWQIQATIFLPILILFIGLIALDHRIAKGDDGTRIKLIVLAFISVLTAFIIWKLDRAKILCWPESLLWQGHALWHVLVGAGIYLTYLNFRSTPVWVVGNG